VAVIDPGPRLDSHRDALAAALAAAPCAASWSPTATPTTRRSRPGLPPRPVRRPWRSVRTATTRWDIGDDPPEVVAAEEAAAAAEADEATDEEPTSRCRGVDRPRVRPDIAVGTGDEVAAGDGWTITALHTPGHTSNHTCFTLDDGTTRTIFTGDHVMGWSTTVVSPPDGDMAAYLESLRVVAGSLRRRRDPDARPADPRSGRLRVAADRTPAAARAQVLDAVRSGLDTIPAIVESTPLYVDVRSSGAVQAGSPQCARTPPSVKLVADGGQMPSVGASRSARSAGERTRREARSTGRRACRPGVAYRGPHPLGGARQVDVAHAEVGDGVDHRVLHRRRGADRGRLADALRPERVERGGCLGRVHLERRQLGRRRDGVVGQVRRDRVAVGVEADLLEQRLANAGSDAAVLLALDEQRREHRAAVVDGDVADEAHLAGLGVDLDHGDVRAERERGTLLVEVELAVELLARLLCRDASSAHVSACAGTPATPIVPEPVSTTMSATSASSRRAASCLALSTIASVAPRTADPPSCSEREPPVPPPVRTRSVSPSTSVILSTGMPVWSLTSIA
jgi:hypothetical protein